MTKPALADAGELPFEGVTVNVSKRGAVARVGHIPVVALPGQLVSAVKALHDRGLHVLSRLAGRELRCTESVTLAQDLAVDHKTDSMFLFRFKGERAIPLPWGVATISLLLEADAFSVSLRKSAYRAGDRLSL